MFVLIWVTLFMSVRGSDADPAQPNGMREHCQQGGYCVRLNDGFVTAEAGLCVEIPCFFTSRFVPERIIWYKCDPSHGDWMTYPVAFDSSLTSKNGRVSLLESDISKKNCSVRINNLIDSDSGSYQLRVEGRGPGHKYTYTVAKANLSLTALKQKPTLVVPPLTEGQQTTLICTAPGLCSGSPPNITWSWRRGGEEDFTITGNITGFHTENLTDFTQRHSSTLTFNPSAEHHGTNITCKISFTGDTTTEETVTLSVTYLKKVIISGNPKVKEGETLNLTCSVDSFPPSDITWTKSGRHRHLKKQDYKRSQQDRRGIGLFSISNVTAEQAGLYVCTAEHRSNTTRKRVNVTVIYKRSLQITGNPSIKKGEDLNLTCSVESFPLSLIKWTKHSENNVYVQTDSGSASLLIPNVTTEDSGRYICTAEHLDEKVSVDADVTVTWFSKILKGSGCVLQSEVLTCVCVSEGFPLPTIRWSLLKNHTEYSVTTKVSNHTVNSSITIRHHGNISVECFSSNGVGEATENLTITDNSPDEAVQPVSCPMMNLDAIIAFISGVVLSAIICFWVVKCCRLKRVAENLNEAVEMVTTDRPLNHDGRVAAENGTPAPGLTGAPKEPQYASIDFSLLRPRAAAKRQKNAETEYAEVKIKKKVEHEAKEMLIEEEKETKDFQVIDDSGEEVYSKVNK